MDKETFISDSRFVASIRSVRANEIMNESSEPNELGYTQIDVHFNFTKACHNGAGTR